MKSFKQISTHLLSNEALQNFDFIDGQFHQYLDENRIKITYQLQQDWLIVDVYDVESGDIYLPLYQKQILGSYTADIVQCIDTTIEKLYKNGQSDDQIKVNLMNWIEETFQVLPVLPLKKDLHVAYLKHKKWFCLFIDVNGKSIGDFTKEKILLCNVKVDTKAIEKWLTYPFIIPAYHMNKKHWLSIRLDQTTDLVIAQQLIEQSFQLVQ